MSKVVTRKEGNKAGHKADSRLQQQMFAQLSAGGLQGSKLLKMAGKLTKKLAKRKAREAGCQNLVAIHKQVPHPRYGDKVPYFETSYEHPIDCPMAVCHAELDKKLAEVYGDDPEDGEYGDTSLRTTAKAAQESAAPHVLGADWGEDLTPSGSKRCVALTRSGSRCKKAARPGVHTTCAQHAGP